MNTKQSIYPNLLLLLNRIAACDFKIGNTNTIQFVAKERPFCPYLINTSGLFIQLENHRQIYYFGITI